MIVRAIRDQRNCFFRVLTIVVILFETNVFAANLLKVSTNNPRYFADSKGKTVYLTGSHTWDNFQDIGRDPSSSFDYSAYLDFLRKHNHNFFRLWTWEQGAWASWTADKLLFHPLPYRRSGPGMALDGNPKFDLEKFNMEYFDRLRQRVKEANAQGIYVSVMLFNGFSVECKQEEKGRLTMLKEKVKKWWKQETYCGANGNPWHGHPFNRHNNINGIDGDVDRDGEGKEVHTLSIPGITRLQEAYVAKVIDVLSELPNVLWDIE